MKKFGIFLFEKNNGIEQEATITLHKIYGGFEFAHLVKKNNYIETNVGQMIKDKNYKSLDLVIKKGESNVRVAAKNSSQNFFIVVEDPKFDMSLSRQDLLNIIENKDISKKMTTALIRFINELKDEFHDSNKETMSELRTKDNNEVEKRYEELINAFQSRVEEYKKAVEQIDSEHSKSANIAKQTAGNMAKKALKNEFFGDNFSAFMSILKKLPEAKFIANLESETKKKIEHRLENFYDHYVEK